METKTPLIILHGWGGSSQSFNKVKELLTQKGHLVYAPDLPGFGQAEPPSEAWSVDDYANWTSDYIKEQNIDEYVLFGHSFGGRIAIKIAARKQGGVKRLILCDAGGLTPREKIKRRAKIAGFRFLSKIIKAVFSLPLLRVFYNQLRRIGYFLAGSRDYYLLQSEVMRKTFKKVIEENLEPFLREIQAPTLIIWGGNDKITPLEDAYLAQKRIGDSRLAILEGVGHSPHLESPEKLSGIISDYLSNS